MYEQIEKPKENKSREVANSVAQKKSNEKQGLGFVDNRPEILTKNTIDQVIGQRRDNSIRVGDRECIQCATIVQKPAVLGFHHWELQYGGEEEGLGEAGQIGAISATEDREARGSSGKSERLLKGKAFIRVADKHISGYTKVGDLVDNDIDERVRTEAQKLKGNALPFNQITNNCQDFVTRIWNKCGGIPDPRNYNERNTIINELTRSPTPEEVQQNWDNMYMHL